MDWPTDRRAIPLSEQGIINTVYTATCPTPADPMIVWGTHVDVEYLSASLQRASQEAGVLISPAHALLWAVARSFAEHPHLNCRVIGRRLYPLGDVNLVIPILDRHRDQVDIVLLRQMQEMSLADVARALWNEVRSQTTRSASARDHRSGFSGKLSKWGNWLGLHAIHHSVRWAFGINNRTRLPNLGFNDQFNAASGVVNYFGFPNAPAMTSYKPSSLPANAAQLSVTMGRGRRQPVVDGERIVIRTLAPLFVRFDHRIGYIHQFAALITTVQRHFQKLAGTASATAHRVETALHPPESSHGSRHLSRRQLVSSS